MKQHLVAVAVKWSAELAFDREVPGSIPATSELISREPAILKFIHCVERREVIKITQALTGLKSRVLHFSRETAISI